MGLIHEYAPTNKFEEKGVMLQENSRNWDQAVARYEKSCTLCSLYQSGKDCATCPIREAFLGNAEWWGLPKDYPWVEQELALE